VTQRSLVAAMSCVFIVGSLHSGLAVAEPGDLWEVTTEMKMAGMEGMQMPARTQKVCSPKQSDQPAGVPKPENNDCEMYDLQRSGSKVSWKMRCTGKHAASGSGEMNYQGKESYNGVMKMSADGRDMEMHMNGHRVGDCDAAEQRRQVDKIKGDAAKAQTQANQYKEQMCANAVETMLYAQLRPESGLNCDPKYKADFCKRYLAEDGYNTLSGRGNQPFPPSTEPPLQEAGTVCGTKAEDVLSKLCTNADKSESLVFLARNCPVQAQPIAQRECAGRGYTTPPAAKYRDFCSNYAGKLLARENDESSVTTTQPAKKENALDKSKKALQGLFGR
jgi:hypothetical protein